MGLAPRAALPALLLFACACPAQTVAAVNCAHFGANATPSPAGRCYADERTGVAQCGGCCPGAADCGACMGGKRTSVYPCASACPELGEPGCAVHSGGVDCSLCCCGTAASANCNASCALFKRQKSNCIPGCKSIGGPFVCAANASCTVCAACCSGTEAASDCEACAKKRCPAARLSTTEAPSPPGQPQVAWTLNDRVIVPYRYGSGERAGRGQHTAFPCGNDTCWLRLYTSKKHSFASAIRSSDGQPQWVQPSSFGGSPISLVTGPQGDGDRTALCSLTETRSADIVACLDSVSGETTLSSALNTTRLPPSYFPRSSKIDSAPAGLLVTYSAFDTADTGARGAAAAAAEVATIGPSSCTCWQAGLNGGPAFGPGSQSGPGKLPPVCWAWGSCGFSCGNEAGDTNCDHEPSKQTTCKCAIMTDLSSACNMSPCSINGSYQHGAACLPSCATAAPAGSIVNPKTGQCVPTPPGTNPCVCTMAADGHTITCPQQFPEPPSFVALFELAPGSGGADAGTATTAVSSTPVFNYSLPARTVLTGDDGTVMPGGLLLLALKTGGLTCAENPDCTMPLEPPLQNLSHSLLVLNMTTGKECWKLDLGFSTDPLFSAAASLRYLGGTVIHVKNSYNSPSSSTVLNASTGEVLWRADGHDLLARPLAGGHDPSVLLSAEGGDDDDFGRSIRALDLRNGSLLWSWPPVQPPVDLDLTITSWSCDWPTAGEVAAGAKDDGICFIKYNCEGSSCPVLLMPLPPLSSSPALARREAETASCGGGRKEGDCVFAMSARTGHLMFSAKAKVGKKYGGSAWGADGEEQLQRVGSMLLFACDASVTAVDSNTAAKLWTIPYTRGNPPSNLAALEQAPAPAGRCDTELQELCGAAKAKGVAACGMCAGTHAGALHSAGCSNKQIDSWCSSSSSSSSSSVTPSSQGSSSSGGQNRTILLFGIEGQDGKPALIAVDGNAGEILWNTPLPGPSASKMSDGLGWGVDVLWAGKSAASAGPAGISVVVAGAFSYEAPGSNAVTPTGSAGGDKGGGGGGDGGGSTISPTDETDKAMISSGGSSRRRLQPWPPPPPPPLILTKHYTWSVDA